ncbi:MAG: DUF2167 domain-containing protein [Gammaproteobacteria bacterium]|nr:MAG: DUF2167 domain-containing protein [Gammaproteobacteria bacterium]
MSKVALLTTVLMFVVTGPVHAQENSDPKADEFRTKLRALKWVFGPHEVTVGGNSTLSLPEGYVYLDEANTTKFEELNENLSSGKEVLVAPKDLGWNAYLYFEGEGYVRDDEKVDADKILKALKESTEAANEERRRRGWSELHVVGWTIPPAYNNTTKRLEWATLLRSPHGEGTNFFTKILGRRGYTSVVLVARPADTAAAVADVNRVLTAYRFNSGDTYAEWRPGDKVAEYGLTGLIVGGAVAAAVKTGLLKGLWKFVVAGVAAFWKVILAAVVAVIAGLKSLFKRKQPQP